ncbi:hypothetical protein NQ317_015152, partial [Molorchus minor]
MKLSMFFLDGAHTIESMEICLKWFKEKTSNSNRNRVLIFNLTGERNPEVFFKQLSKAKFDIVIFVPNVGSDKDSADTVDHILPTDQQLRRCEAYSKKWSQMQSNGKTETIKLFPSFSRAVNFIQNQGMCDILVTGSIHLIGAALSVLNPTLNGKSTKIFSFKGFQNLDTIPKKSKVLHREQITADKRD